jgi:magnesium transporter
VIRHEVVTCETLRWVDITAPDRADLQALAEEFALPHTAVEDCLDPEHLPKVERFDEITFLIVRVRDREAPDDVSSIQGLTRKISIFFRPGLILSVHRADLEEMAQLRATHAAHLANGGDAPAQWLILSQLVLRALDSFEKPLERSEGLLDGFEEGLFDDDIEPPSLKEAYHLKRRVALSRRIIYATGVALQKLVPPGDRAEPLFHDMRETADAYLFWADQMLDEVNLFLQIHLAMSSKRTNEVMRILTVFSAFFLPLTFIVGVYGMNFRVMPELQQPWGYPAVLVAMLAVVVGIYVWVRGKGWLA